MNPTRDELYAQLLHIGFIVLRQAIDAKDQAWIDAEIEFLHNIPSLMGESNINRHRYFWNQERSRYIEWVNSSGSDLAKSRMHTYYLPLMRNIPENTQLDDGISQQNGEDLYSRLLHIGFIVLRQAVEAKDELWVEAELEFLHNIPSLMGESNINRHRYFWNQERSRYIEWVNSSGSDLAKSRMHTYYLPLMRNIPENTQLDDGIVEQNDEEPGGPVTRSSLAKDHLKMEARTNPTDEFEEKSTRAMPPINAASVGRAPEQSIESNLQGNGQTSEIPNRQEEKDKGEFVVRTIKVKRCAAVVKGGRRFSFAALVVVGDDKGRVGYGYAKGNEVPQSVAAAKKQAIASLFTVPLEGGTVPHRTIGRYGTASVILLPARPGTGLIAGAAVRAVCEVVGIRDLLTKAYGTNNPVVVVKATIDALQRLRKREEFDRQQASLGKGSNVKLT